MIHLSLQNFRLMLAHLFRTLRILQDILLIQPTISVNQISSIIPMEYQMYQNYPNPFNPSTNIKFEIPKSSVTKLIVYDITGKELGLLLNEKLEAGTYEYNWNAAEYSSGVYFYRVESGNFTATKRMLLVK